MLHLHYRQNMNLAQLSHSHIPHLPRATSFSRYVQLQNMKLAFITTQQQNNAPTAMLARKFSTSITDSSKYLLTSNFKNAHHHMQA
jgi:hypothetical protein